MPISDFKDVRVTMDPMPMPLPLPGHWYVDDDWIQTGTHDGYPEMEHVHVVRGPATFDRIEARDREHAETMAAELNRVYGRTVPPKTEAEPERCEVADSLGDALADRGFRVRVHGDTITIK